jgi:cell filamentation protein
MFDPFKDFETAGYLRNVRKDKHPAIIKHFEHNLFRANMDSALSYLASCKRIGYSNYLHVHHLLFGAYYPWAGKDRAAVAPTIAVNKGGVMFAHPMSAQLAVEAGLQMGSDTQIMNKKPGEVLGLMAFGHPFLDGNGRTMLLIHMELCFRAGFSIAWDRVKPSDFLSVLTEEIDQPGKGILDAYLLPFKGSAFQIEAWSQTSGRDSQ